MTAEQRRRELPKAIIKWYTIEKESRTACIVSEHGNSARVAEALKESGHDAACIPLETLEDRQGAEEGGGFGNRAAGAAPAEADRGGAYDNDMYDNGMYDIIVAVDVLEYADDVPFVLSRIGGLLKPEGKLQIGRAHV